MPISTNLWRAKIGTFGIMIAKLCVMNTWSSITKAKFQNSFVLSFFLLITVLSFLLILSNDVELNVCLSETWLDSPTSIDSNDLSLKCYNLHGVDNPDNFKKEGFMFIIKKP